MSTKQEIANVILSAADFNALLKGHPTNSRGRSRQTQAKRWSQLVHQWPWTHSLPNIHPSMLATTPCKSGRRRSLSHAI